MITVLCIGDIVGAPGLEITEQFLAKRKNKYDFIVANAENAAGGFGITKNIAETLFSSGVDVITTGNHIWNKMDIAPYMETQNRLLRPLNYPEISPGRGYTVVKMKKDNRKIAVINIQGQVFMPPINSPFEKIKELIAEIKKETNTVIVDFHAEATSEKYAMGWFLDGSASLVYGTHTHVMTADNRIFPNGTGYISDLGMVGSVDGVIGMRKEEIINRFLTSLHYRFKVDEGNTRFNAIQADIDENGKCVNIQRLDLAMNEI